MRYERVILEKVFHIESTKQDDKINMNILTINEKHSVPFLGRKSTNNGVSDYVEPKLKCMNEGNVITLALDGSTGATFYQHHAFCSGQNIWKLSPKKEYLDSLKPLIAMYLITTIRKAVEVYSYNLSLTKSRLQKIKILLPLNDDNMIDEEYIIQRMSDLYNVEILNNISDEKY